MDFARGPANQALLPNAGMSECGWGMCVAGVCGTCTREWCVRPRERYGREVETEREQGARASG